MIVLSQLPQVFERQNVDVWEGGLQLVDVCELDLGIGVVDDVLHILCLGQDLFQQRKQRRVGEDRLALSLNKGMSNALFTKGVVRGGDRDGLRGSTYKYKY